MHDRISWQFYQSGHMLYIDSDQHAKLKKDVTEFISERRSEIAVPHHLGRAGRRAGPLAPSCSSQWWGNGAPAVFVGHLPSSRDSMCAMVSVRTQVEVRRNGKPVIRLR